MKLDKRLWALLAAVLLVFHVLAFFIPFVHTTVFWIAYACTLVTFAVLGYTRTRVLKNKRYLESIILGWPILRASCIATVTQLVAFFIFAVLASICPVEVAIVVEVILLIVTFITLLVRDTTEKVVKIVEQTAPDTSAAVKHMRAMAWELLNNNSDPALQSSLEKLNDALRYADPVSNTETAQVDAMIIEKIAEISTNVDIAKILHMINQRSELCKVSKAKKA